MRKASNYYNKIYNKDSAKYLICKIKEIGKENPE